MGDRGHNRFGPKTGWDGCALFLGVAGSPPNTKSPGPRPTSIPIKWHLDAFSTLATTDRAENWEGEESPLFREGELGPRLTQCRLGRGLPPHQVASCSVQPFGRNRHGSKIGGLHALFGEGVQFLCNIRSHGLRPTSIPSGIWMHPAIWPQHISDENWGLCLFAGGEAGSPSNTMWPGPRPTSTPSFILIHPTIWPQCTNFTV